MKTAYLHAFSGLSGDMLVGALLDLGADFAELKGALATLPISGYKLSTQRKNYSGISALKFDVEVTEAQPERNLGEICSIIAASDLSNPVKRRSEVIFRLLAEAEAKVHRTALEKVHFHEVGAVDSIVDIVSTAWAVDHLEIAGFIVSALPGGTGFAHSRHGVIPVPAPATAELLAGFPVLLNDGEAELVTPTGAAILKALARPAAVPLSFQIEKIGYGAGSRDLRDRPNVLRVMAGSETDKLASDEMLEIQANIDDLNPQVYDYVSEKLFEAGARDVTIVPVIMKKGRPAVMLSILAEATERDRIARVLFAETTTIGLRYHPVSRLKLAREVREVRTRWGVIHVKVSGSPGAPLTLSPEYEDCRRVAEQHNVPLRGVLDEALARAREQLS
jgi:pyridinium-3,5-bisthiocarboxylic acid mononucleotide nickel chelatase